MFTGIIESLGQIKKIISDKTNQTFWLESSIAKELKIDESLCHNGVCLTIEEIIGAEYRVTAIRETLIKTDMQRWKVNDIVNLERSMQMNARLDGHIVQGHVDGTAVCISKKDFDGSFEFSFRFDEQFASLIIEKGSVCVNGVSLTAFNISRNTFTVAIIPYTFSHTNFKNIEEETVVNIEFDVLGKYVNRQISLR